jgi:uncharacterized phage protein (TIGR01671 family)
MRGIKFRAFFKKEKKIYKVAIIAFDENSCTLIDDNGECRCVMLFNVELMQYTGLKDKNGKEIYEGDICKPVGLGMSHFETGVCSLYSKNNHHVWLPNGSSHNYTDGSDWEIIGNIHDNKELL